MKHNYHGHTQYSNHSTFSVEDIIKQSIVAGFETTGISEHVHLKQPGELWRIPSLEEAKEYVAEVNKFKEVYKDKIRVLCGFEVEAIDPQTGKVMVDDIKEILTWDGVDYVIWAFHFYQDNTHQYSSLLTWDKAKFVVETMKELVKTGMLKYVAHPDGYMEGCQGEWTEEVAWLTEQIATIAGDNDIIMSINVNGIAHGKSYPSQKFWDVMGKHGVTATVELDAHGDAAFESKHIEAAEAMAKKAGVKLIDKVW